MASRHDSLALLRSLPSVILDTASISVFLPRNLKDGDVSWCQMASENLQKFGMVALRSSSFDIVDHKICDDADHAAITRLEEMQKRIVSRGLDPTGADEPYRFSEVICRDEGGKRYDVPVDWLGKDEEIIHNAMGSGRIGTPLEQSQQDAIAKLQEAIDQIVKPVVETLWSSQQQQDEQQKSSYVAAAGFLINRPGSQSQNWHRDGPDEGYIDCFVPLVDLDNSLGPTALQPGTHHKEDGGDGAVVVPLLQKGEILLFDYRTLHRGQGNQSEAVTRTLAYAVYKRKDHGESSNNHNGDIHNYPAALTLEYD